MVQNSQKCMWNKLKTLQNPSAKMDGVDEVCFGCPSQQCRTYQVGSRVAVRYYKVTNEGYQQIYLCS